MVSLRLPQELEDKLNVVSSAKNITKSEIIKQALAAWFSDYDRTQSPYELGQDLFGKYGSSKNDLSKTYKKRLKDKLHEKYAH
ncbi:hypothetical protein QUF76_14010 [Desulfobacterales bacterium HSG16]|nr:hypothetical protein [Desulfobacterales bacterium HSG16]